MERAPWAEQVLAESTIGFLAVTDEAGAPYVVPISFALRGDRIVFHGGLGRKATALAAHPRGSLAAVSSPELVRGDRPCDDNFRYRSVLASGPVELLEEPDVREEALRAVVAKYHPSAADVIFDPDTFARTLVYSLQMEEGGTMGHDIELRSATATPLISIRARTTIAALPALMGAFDELFGYLGQHQVQPVGPPLAIYHEMTGEKIDVEIGVPVARALESKGRIQAGELPAGDEAHTLHVGAYETVGPVYEEMEAWMQAQGMVQDGPPREYYVNSPDEVSSPEEYRTEVVWPVRRA